MTHNDWILDVLADLKSFASANGLGALAEQLDDTKLIAAAEIASQNEKAQARLNGEHGQLEPDLGGLGRHQRA
ncbi:hypothetical protein [Sedimentitalea arenosa]|jgi:hypothetical protein|uniref:Uncharacterized protein n=1 Tax=Sedimentitalea arenosa TaxID=2798803 RepID=A0A8J7IJY1_9RHOB|nr:hypothetical protein [Arenibacterium arenosum]MBJ6372992.1 hypothetical protein [Arenibacterium arenosum]